ncbi:hypothetical protein NC651_022187 [Populus alba x Populus x berolinensis]|nr:hypothetical protein NC651_022187 [Populus alba x Populus x berolinensis]
MCLVSYFRPVDIRTMQNQMCFCFLPD